MSRATASTRAKARRRHATPTGLWLVLAGAGLLLLLGWAGWGWPGALAVACLIAAVAGGSRLPMHVRNKIAATCGAAAPWGLSLLIAGAAIAFTISAWPYFGIVGAASILAGGGCLIFFLLAIRQPRHTLAVCLVILLSFMLMLLASGDTPEAAWLRQSVSLLGWIIAPLSLVIYARHARRVLPILLALLLGVSAFGLALVNSDLVDAIKTDMTVTMAKQKQVEQDRQNAEREAAQQEADRIKARDRGYSMATPEIVGVPMDTTGQGSVTTERPPDYLQTQIDKSIAATQPGGAGTTEGGEPAYRQGGKVVRETTGQLVQAAEALDPAATQPSWLMPARMMQPAQQVAAKTHDAANLFVMRSVLLATLILIVLDYLGRFNKTFDYLSPFALAGRWIDKLSSKSTAVHVTGLEDHPHRLRIMGTLLDAMLRKGETFIYLGSHDPLEQVDRGWFGRTWRWMGLALGGVVLLPMLGWGLDSVMAWLVEEPVFSFSTIAWGLAWTCLGLSLLLWLRRFTARPMVYAQSSPPFSRDFLFESLYFGRHAFVITGSTLPPAVLDDLVRFLHDRRIPHARARRTVNIVWDMPSPIPPAVLHDLAWLAAQTNYKLITLTPTTIAPEPASRESGVFDEVIPARALLHLA